MILNLKIEDTHIPGIRLMNDKIYVEKDEGLDIAELLVGEAENINHSLFTKKAIQKWYSGAMYASDDKLNDLLVGEKAEFGDGAEKLEITRETKNLYSGRWVKTHINVNYNLNLNENKKQSVKVNRKRILICK